MLPPARIHSSQTHAGQEFAARLPQPVTWRGCRLGAAVSHAPRRCASTGNALRGGCVSASCCHCAALRRMWPGIWRHGPPCWRGRACLAMFPRACEPGARLWAAVAWYRAGDAALHILLICVVRTHIWPTVGQACARNAQSAVVVGEHGLSLSLSIYLSPSLSHPCRAPPRPSLPTLAPLPPFHLHLPCIALPTNPPHTVPCLAMTCQPFMPLATL